MASSVGKTVEGTDGSDHLFREQVASQYKISASFKTKLKMYLFPSIIPWAVVFLHFLQQIIGLKLTYQVLPKFENWEYVYLFAIIFIIIGYLSLQRNQILLLTIYKYGVSVLSVIPLMYAFFSHLSELKDMFYHAKFKAYLFGFPLPTLYYAFIVLSVSINLHCITCAIKLLNAWRERGFKKKNK